MTLRKTAINNSVRYISEDGHSHSKQSPHFSKERDSEQNTRKKKASIIKLSQKKKKLQKNITGEALEEYSCFYVLTRRPIKLTPKSSLTLKIGPTSDSLGNMINGIKSR